MVRSQNLSAAVAAVLLMALAPAISGQMSKPVPPGAAGSAEHVVLVELFTSQGCSSCPPADRLLTSLGVESAGRVVPLAFHVDYWNSQGWKDPFSASEWTRRQTAHARVLGLQTVYSPQAVVDGSVELIGSNSEALAAAIATCAARPGGAITLGLEPAGADVIVHANVALPESLRQNKLDLMFALYEKGLETQVGRGENGGRTLANDYVVRILRNGDRVSPGGAAQSQHTIRLRLEKEWNRKRLGVAAFLQDPDSLRIFGSQSSPVSDGDRGTTSESGHIK